MVDKDLQAAELDLWTAKTARINAESAATDLRLKRDVLHAKRMKIEAKRKKLDEKLADIQNGIARELTAKRAAEREQRLLELRIAELKNRAPVDAAVRELAGRVNSPGMPTATPMLLTFDKWFRGSRAYSYAAIRPAGSVSWWLTGEKTHPMSWGQLTEFIQHDEKDRVRALKSVRIGPTVSLPCGVNPIV